MFSDARFRLPSVLRRTSPARYSFRLPFLYFQPPFSYSSFLQFWVYCTAEWPWISTCSSSFLLFLFSSSSSQLPSVLRRTLLIAFCSQTHAPSPLFLPIVVFVFPTTVSLFFFSPILHLKSPFSSSSFSPTSVVPVFSRTADLWRRSRHTILEVEVEVEVVAGLGVGCIALQRNSLGLLSLIKVAFESIELPGKTACGSSFLLVLFCSSSGSGLLISAGRFIPNPLFISIALFVVATTVFSSSFLQSVGR